MDNTYKRRNISLKIVSIEPTPSPYSMKINIDEPLKENQTENYKQDDDLSHAPEYVKQLFTIHGVKGLYRVVDFIALERNPRVPWEEILPQVRQTLGSAEDHEEQSLPQSETKEDAFGEIKVYIQMFRGIPMQIKLQEAEQEERIGLPERFAAAAMEASKDADNYLMERKWIEQSPRYGDIKEIGVEVKEELAATYDTARLTQLVEKASSETSEDVPQQARKTVTLEMLDQSDWKARYAALDQMDPTLEDLTVLDKALDDEKASIRRLATAYLGMIEEKEVLPYLYKALEDKAVNVRRTAGDCLSDLGFKEATPAMIKALSDKNRLVRWRAAMFLYEVGDETAIPALQKAMDDQEFEVRMQVKMALARIEGGEEAKGSIWSQMTEAAKR